MLREQIRQTHWDRNNKKQYFINQPLVLCNCWYWPGFESGAILFHISPLYVRNWSVSFAQYYVFRSKYFANQFLNLTHFRSQQNLSIFLRSFYTHYVHEKRSLKCYIISLGVSTMIKEKNAIKQNSMAAFRWRAALFSSITNLTRTARTYIF